MALSKIKGTGIADSSVTSAKILDGTIVNADVSPSADISASKICGAVTTTQVGALEQNIALLGFKMAVNDGLTVFNLVDGVVDEFHDESGADEGEGSNDTYCSSSDYYINSTSPSGVSIGPFSAGFSTTAATEGDTSTTGTNPDYGAGTFGTFTVPSGASAMDMQVWGAAGGSSMHPQGTAFDGGGGGYAEGTLAVTASQVFDIVVGEGGFGHRFHDTGTKVASLGGGGNTFGTNAPEPDGHHGGGGGLSGIFNVANEEISQPQMASCQPSTRGTYPSSGVTIVAGGGGGSGNSYRRNTCEGGHGGGGGGLVGAAGGSVVAQTNNEGPGPGPHHGHGGGGDQEQGGQGGQLHPQSGETGGFLYGGAAHRAGGTTPTADDTPAYSGSGGAGFYGGGGGSACSSQFNSLPSGRAGAGGGGSSYYGHPQVTSGSTEAAFEGSTPICAVGTSGGATQPGYVSGVGSAEVVASIPQYSSCGGNGGVHAGNDGYALITINNPATTTSTTIVSNAFTAGSAPTVSRIVVFQENVATPTLNTDIIASISRDGGSTFTTATLSDSGYVTGSSGQRILTGTATISGQPSGTSMRWKLALANNAVKIHGVSLQWK
jgi:hypothetical protein